MTTSSYSTFEIMGSIGGGLIALSLVPQVYKVHRTQSATDIAYSYQAVYIAGLTLMNIYAVALQLWPVYGPAIFEESLIITLTIQKFIYDRRAVNRVDDVSRHSAVSIPSGDTADAAASSTVQMSTSTTRPQTDADRKREGMKKKRSTLATFYIDDSEMDDDPYDFSDNETVA